MSKTIKQKDYPEFFEYYESLIKEMDDVLGGWMNAPFNSPDFFYKNWETIQYRMVTTMCKSIEEFGKEIIKE